MLALGLRSDGEYAADTTVFSIPRQVGKALDVETPMLTANRGWTTMGELVAGDYVFGADGTPTEVLAAHPVRLNRECYRVRTTDGREVIADAEHLWTVADRNAERSKGPLNARVRWHETRTLTTRDLLNAGLRRTTRANGRNEWRFQLPRQGAVRRPVADLPIDPYVFGAWLGDGTGVNGTFTVHEDDMPHLVNQLKAGGYSPRAWAARSAWMVRASAAEGGRRQTDSLAGRLRTLGVLGDKHVPDVYLAASAEQREALLQGLMDTDGSIGKTGKCEFTSTNRGLAEATLFLARSLGWRATIHESDAKLNGRTVGRRWRVTFMPKTHDEFTPFRLPRKAARVANTPDTHGRHTVSICSIEPVDTRPVRCITVAASDSLYLAGRDLIVTHNTYLIGCIIFALCLMKPGLRVIWTAQVKDTALETFAKFLELASSPRVKPHIARTPQGKGDEAIVFNNGSSIEFGARESGFGRGRTDVDVIVFDEGQHLSNNALENLGAAQNVAVNPLCFVMGTPPRPQDKGEWFTLLRQEALDGDSDGTLYIEFSADRGADPMDRDQWRKANPSFPARTSERAMLRLRKKLKNPDSWNREALGIWDKVTKRLSPINGALWADAVDVGPPADSRPAGLAVDMSHGRAISVGACWVEGESAHLEEVWAGVDEPAAVEWVAATAGRRTPVLIDSMSPAASMIPALKAKRVKVFSGSASEMSRACGLVVADLLVGRLTHAGQGPLDKAREGARKRAIGNAGGWGYDRSDASVDISPLVAVTLARLAAAMNPRRNGNGAASVGNDQRRAVVL